MIIPAISISEINEACTQKLALPDMVQKAVGCDKLSMKFLDPHIRSMSMMESRIINAT